MLVTQNGCRPWILIDSRTGVPSDSGIRTEMSVLAKTTFRQHSCSTVESAHACHTTDSRIVGVRAVDGPPEIDPEATMR